MDEARRRLPRRGPDVDVRVGGAIARLQAGTAQLRAAASAQAAGSELQMQQRIWIEWMAELPADASHRLLDEDAIENHLRAIGVFSGDGKSGLLKVDFESWTSGSDTDEAVDAAKGERIHAYRDTFGPQQVGRSGTISVVVGPNSANPAYSLKLPGTRWDWPVAVSRPSVADQSAMPLKSGEAVRVTGYDPATRTLSGVAD